MRQHGIYRDVWAGPTFGGTGRVDGKTSDGQSLRVEERELYTTLQCQTYLPAKHNQPHQAILLVAPGKPRRGRYFFPGDYIASARLARKYHPAFPVLSHCGVVDSIVKHNSLYSHRNAR